MKRFRFNDSGVALNPDIVCVCDSRFAWGATHLKVARYKGQWVYGYELYTNEKGSFCEACRQAPGFRSLRECIRHGLVLLIDKLQWVQDKTSSQRELHTCQQTIRQLQQYLFEYRQLILF